MRHDERPSGDQILDPLGGQQLDAINIGRLIKRTGTLAPAFASMKHSL
jgi:hypothetical protein